MVSEDFGTDPDLLVSRGTDPRIRIRTLIRTKFSRIRNAAFLTYRQGSFFKWRFLLNFLLIKSWLNWEIFAHRKWNTVQMKLPLWPVAVVLCGNITVQIFMFKNYHLSQSCTRFRFMNSPSGLRRGAGPGPRRSRSTGSLTWRASWKVTSTWIPTLGKKSVHGWILDIYAWSLEYFYSRMWEAVLLASD